jgi:hypothetical protein
MDELEILKIKQKNLQLLVKLLALCSESASEYSNILNQSGIILNNEQKLELYCFCAVLPFMSITNDFYNNEQMRTQHIIAFLEGLLGTQPDYLTHDEFNLLGNFLRIGDDDAGVMNIYYKNWMNSIRVKQGEERNEVLKFIVCGIHVELADRLANWTNEISGLWYEKNSAEIAGDAVKVMSIFSQELKIKDQFNIAYMNQINLLMGITVKYYSEIGNLTQELV